MYNASLENQLIVVDIANVMQDYTSIQIDIDESKVKAAELVAQNVDLKRLIGKDNIQRAIDPQDETDENLKELLIPPLCYYTYSRCLRMFQGIFTDAGYTTETEADDRNSAKSVSNEMRSIGDVFMQDVSDFLEAENPDEIIDSEKLAPNIRVFGGKESRES